MTKFQTEVSEDQHTPAFYFIFCKLREWTDPCEGPQAGTDQTPM